MWFPYPLIMLDNLLLRLPLHFTALHPTVLHSTSLHFSTLHFHLNFTHLHFTTLSFGLTPFKFPTAPFHLTSLHFTSLHFTELLDDFRYTSIPFISPRNIPFKPLIQGTWHIMFENYVFFILFIVCEYPGLILGCIVGFFFFYYL